MKLAAMLFLAAAPALAAVPAPHLAAQSVDQLAKPLPLPYDEGVAADAAVAAAGAPRA